MTTPSGARGCVLDLGEAFWVMDDVADAEAAIEATRRLRPDVVAADLRMPNGGGIRVAAEVADVCPVVILTVSEAESDLLDAIAAGASGYLVKSSSTEELRSGLFRAAAGEPVFSPAPGGAGARRLRHPGNHARRRTGEAAVDARTGGAAVKSPVGATYREIGERLFIAEKTVENHVRNILDKLRLRRRTELVRWAVKRGMDE